MQEKKRIYFGADRFMFFDERGKKDLNSKTSKDIEQARDIKSAGKPPRRVSKRMPLIPESEIVTRDKHPINNPQTIGSKRLDFPGP